MIKNELELLRGVFNLREKETTWGLVEEISSSTKEATYKPGLYIRGSRVYVDLYARRFYSTVKLLLPEFERNIYEATIDVADDEHIVITAKENADKFVVLSKTFVSDIYGVTVYGEWMEDRLLL